MMLFPIMIGNALFFVFHWFWPRLIFILANLITSLVYIFARIPLAYVYRFHLVWIVLVNMLASGGYLYIVFHDSQLIGEDFMTMLTKVKHALF